VRSIGSPSFRSFYSLHFGRFPHPFSLAEATVNFVNFMNLPTPYCICNVKNGEKLRFCNKQREITLHRGHPYPMFTKFTKFTSSFFRVFDKKNWFWGSRMTRFSLKSLINCELYEYLCTYCIPKAFFCYGVKKGGVNFVNLVFFEVHRKEAWLLLGKRPSECPKSRANLVIFEVHRMCELLLLGKRPSECQKERGKR